MFGEDEITTWMLAFLIVVIIWAVLVSIYREPKGPAPPPLPPPKRPTPPPPISGAVEEKIKLIQHLSSPTLSRDPGAVFDVLAPEVLSIVKGYEAKVEKFSKEMEDYAQKLKEKK